MGFQNEMTQTIQVVDNLVPVVQWIGHLVLGMQRQCCVSPIVAEDECGGAVSLVNRGLRL